MNPVFQVLKIGTRLGIELKKRETIFECDAFLRVQRQRQEQKPDKGANRKKLHG
jgi:hypothetical protein